MAKAKAKAPSAAQPRRVSRTDSEQLNRLLLIGGVVAVLMIAAGVIIYGWWATQVKPLGDTILAVGDTEFTLGHYERRLEQEIGDGLPPGTDPFAYTESVILQLQREGLLIEGAATLDISVTDEDIAAEVRQQGGLAEEVEAEAYAAEFKRQVDESGLREGEYRQQLKADLIEQRVRNYFTFLLPTTEPQVRGRWIVTQEEADAEAALQRIAAGEAFEDVATELSLDNIGSTREGDLQWSVRGGSGLLPTEIEDYLFTAEPEGYSDVIETDRGFYVVQLIERDDERELDETQRIQAAGREMNAWLEELPETITVERDFEQDDAIRALDDIF